MVGILNLTFTLESIIFYPYTKINPMPEKQIIDTITNLPDEIWKPIPEFEQYEISNYGRVKSKQRNKITLKKLQLTTDNKYYRVQLCGSNKSRRFLIHRLVGCAFIPNPDNLPQINHKDGNGLNNHADNLEWVTEQENNQHAKDNKLQKYNNITYRKPIIQLDLNDNVVNKFRSTYEAAKCLKYKRSKIRNVVLGYRIHYRGFKFINDVSEDNTNQENKKQRQIIPVTQFDLDMNEVKRYKSMAEAAREIGCSAPTICDSINQPNRTVHGFIFKKTEI